MSDYITTRGGPAVALREALFAGTAPDGGLYVPKRLPSIVWPPPSSVEGGRDPRAIAAWVAPALFPSVEPDVLYDVVDAALDFPIPLVEVEPGIWVMELFHGPTGAFKDVGARFMAGLMSALGDDTSRTILVATSGDTGGAVAAAFHGRPGFDVVALFPAEGVSPRQRRQMTTLGANVHAVAVRGTFDDCQRMAKTAFAETDLARTAGLTSANSINIARLLPQSIYYLHASNMLGPVGFVVPSGNLGNLCAGLMAAAAGMPSGGFTAASNENRGFVDYLRGDPFRARPSRRTTSNAMDVGAPSNLERIRWLYGDNDDAVRSAVRGEAVSETDVAACIARVQQEAGYVLDPHTAVAYVAASRHNPSGGTPTVVLATAHPSKFPETVERAIGRPVPPHPGFPAPDALEEVTTIDPDDDALARLLRGLHA